MAKMLRQYGRDCRQIAPSHIEDADIQIYICMYIYIFIYLCLSICSVTGAAFVFAGIGQTLARPWKRRHASPRNLKCLPFGRTDT